jgi:hypothetical protein
MLSIMIEMTLLAQRSEVEQRSGHVVHVEDVRHRQNNLATSNRMRLTVLDSAPLAPIARPVEPHEATTQLPVRRIRAVVDGHLSRLPYLRNPRLAERPHLANRFQTVLAAVTSGLDVDRPHVSRKVSVLQRLLNNRSP